MTGLRVYVDGSKHPIHDNAPSLSAALELATGETAEVQLARLGPELVLIVAGDTTVDRDSRGYLRVIVYPTAGRPAIRAAGR